MDKCETKKGENIKKEQEVSNWKTWSFKIYQEK